MLEEQQPTDAETYNRIRRIVFSVANNPEKGFNLARQYLDETYRAKLGPRSYAGLSAELQFYERHQNEFHLTVAGDMGEHADFAGMYGGKPTRFDVTTNLEYKNLRNYEPFVGKGIFYKVALLDKSNFEIVDIIDLAFEPCSCGGRLIPFVTIFEYIGWKDEGLAMTVCSKCKAINEVNGEKFELKTNVSEYIENARNMDPTLERDRIFATYNVEHYKYFRSKYDENLMGIAFPHVGSIGAWAVEFTFLNKVIDVDLSGQLASDDWIRSGFLDY